MSMSRHWLRSEMISKHGSDVFFICPCIIPSLDFHEAVSFSKPRIFRFILYPSTQGVLVSLGRTIVSGDPSKRILSMLMKLKQSQIRTLNGTQCSNQMSPSFRRFVNHMTLSYTQVCLQLFEELLQKISHYLHFPSISLLVLPLQGPPSGCLKQHKFTISQFWRLEVQVHGVGRGGSF